MVVVVLAFVALSAWAVVVDAHGACVLGRTQDSSRLVCVPSVLLFAILVGLLLWSYFVTVVTDPGTVPKGWTPFAEDEEAGDELERLTTAHNTSERLAGSARPRYCRKCMAWKPPRAHHDSVSGRCVMKMDHYCVWVINCIGLLNYKAFILFLVYACLACGLAAALLLGAFVRFLMDGRGENTPSALVFIAFVVDTAFTLCLAGFLVMHGRLIAVNCTTIEMYEKRRVPQWPYDRGARSNFQDVFGYRVIRWFVPCYTAGEKEELLNGLLRQHSRFQDMKLTELAADL